MNQDIFIYTLPQWFVFAALIIIAYGWVEKKKNFRLIGTAIFILLGIFAVYSIYAGYFAANEFLTPDEIMDEELEEENLTEIPFHVRLLPAYWSFVLSGFMAIPALYFDWKEKRPKRLFLILSVLAALFGFFIIVGELKMV
jgi:predicted membrane channel-forming protein YqfA (hemolysin III family)